MIVVADTSVILNLCRVQHELLLQQLYHRVLIQARRRQIIPEISPVLKRLETEAGFGIAPNMRARVLAIANEQT